MLAEDTEGYFFRVPVQNEGFRFPADAWSDGSGESAAGLRFVQEWENFDQPGNPQQLPPAEAGDQD